MIPKIIHYCWFGRGEMPELALKCIESWHKYMPYWEYKLWNEDNFDVNSVPYVKEAYEARKFAFVSDYVRLVALEQYGGLYLDTDVEVFKPFDDLLAFQAFVGFEGSKRMPVGTCVIGTESHGRWAKEQLDSYGGRHFIMENGVYDLTANTAFITDNMIARGFVADGKEKEYEDLHVFPVDYFCPRQTTGEYCQTENTYCDHLGLCSWCEKDVKGWKGQILRAVGPKSRVRIIKLKRLLFG